MAVVEDVFSRTYSKGAQLFIQQTGPAAFPSPLTEAYILAMQAVAGVKTIKGPKMGRDKVELQELDQSPPSGPSTADLTTAVDFTTTPADTREQYYNKVKAPGDKDMGPVVTALNMTKQQYAILHRLYVNDIPFPWLINLKVKAVAGGGTRCFFLGYGFITDLSMDIQPSALVQASCSIQPAYGIGYISACRALSSLTRVFNNFIPVPACT